MNGNVGGSFHYFGPDWNISTLELCFTICVPQKMRPTDFWDTLTGYLVTLLFFSEIT